MIEKLKTDKSIKMEDEVAQASSPPIPIYDDDDNQLGTFYPKELQNNISVEMPFDWTIIGSNDGEADRAYFNGCENTVYLFKDPVPKSELDPTQDPVSTPDPCVGGNIEIISEDLYDGTDFRVYFTEPTTVEQTLKIDCTYEILSTFDNQWYKVDIVAGDETFVIPAGTTSINGHVNYIEPLVDSGGEQGDLFIATNLCGT